jgi:hypothetical protein
MEIEAFMLLCKRVGLIVAELDKGNEGDVGGG